MSNMTYSFHKSAQQVWHESNKRLPGGYTFKLESSSGTWFVSFKTPISHWIELEQTESMAEAKNSVEHYIRMITAE